MKEKRKYQICTETVMDTSDSKISFNSDGVCDHVIDFKKNVKPLFCNFEERGKELNKLVENVKIKGKNKEYDCLLGLSGGLDSSYMLHFAIKELGLRPLVFHVDCGWNTDYSVHNINVLVDALKVDLYTDVVDWEQMRKLQLVFFKSGLPNIDMPQDNAFIAALHKYANKFNIKYILNGGNVATEGVRNPLEFFYYGTDMVQLKYLIKKFGDSKFEKLNFSSVYNHKIYMRFIKGVKVIKPLNYIDFNKSKATSVLVEKYGWIPYPQKHFESRFTRFYEGFWLPERFGFDTRRVQLSSLILSNQMSRDKALEILKSPALDQEMVKKEFEFVARKLEISKKQLHDFFNMPKRFYWDYPNQVRVFNLGAKILKFFSSEFAIKR